MVVWDRFYTGSGLAVYGKTVVSAQHFSSQPKTKMACQPDDPNPHFVWRFDAALGAFACFAFQSSSFAMLYSSTQRPSTRRAWTRVPSTWKPIFL